MNLVKAFKCRVYPRASKYISRAILAEGTLRGADQPFRCLFADNSPFTEYSFSKFYTEQPHILRKWKIWIPSLKRLLDPPLEDFDLCIAVLPERYDPLFRGVFSFRGQEYVRQFIDTSGTWEEIRKRFHKSKRKAANKLETEYGFSYRISTEPGDFDFFYNRMHVPLIRRQFGELSDIEPYDDMKKYFREGFLFLVMHRGRPVAGSLCFARDSILVARRAGILDGGEEYRKGGAQMALYYLRIKFAKEQNYRKIDTMKTRPFLNDGIYMTKREWGASVCRDDEATTRVYYFIPRNSEQIRSFFHDNPAIVCTESGLKGVIGINGSAEVSDRAERELTRQFSAQGLGGLILLTPDGKKQLEITL